MIFSTLLRGSVLRLNTSHWGQVVGDISLERSLIPNDLQQINPFGTRTLPLFPQRMWRGKFITITFLQSR